MTVLVVGVVAAAMLAALGWDPGGLTAMDGWLTFPMILIGYVLALAGWLAFIWWLPAGTRR